MPRQEQDQAAVAGFVPCLFDGGPQPVHFRPVRCLRSSMRGSPWGLKLGLNLSGHCVYNINIMRRNTMRASHEP